MPETSVNWFEIPVQDLCRAATSYSTVLKRVAASGGEELVPKTSIGAFGSIGQFIDTEGNRTALHNSKTTTG